MICVHTCGCICHRGKACHIRSCCDGKCKLCQSPIKLGKMEAHLTICHKVADEALKSKANAKQEFERGYRDGRVGRDPSAINPHYLKGYHKGTEVRRQARVLHHH